MVSIRKDKKYLFDLGEFGLIDYLRKSNQSKGAVFKGIGDDTAVVSYTNDKYLLLTKDLLVEGVHFTKKSSALDIGHKALACSLSDIAAMGGTPSYCLVGLGAPAKSKVKYIKDIYEGIRRLAKKHSLQLIGGDTVKSSKMTISVTVIGEVKKKDLILRSGAKAGDQIYVTGPLGNSLKSTWHQRFIPRLKESQMLINQCKPSAMIDISDGLAADLNHILKESKVGATLRESNIPRRRGASLQQALYEGEDFELLFTVSKKSLSRLMRLSKNKVKFYLIGEVIPGRNRIFLENKAGRKQKIPESGFKHY